jgi:hypothetical protein
MRSKIVVLFADISIIINVPAATLYSSQGCIHVVNIFWPWSEMRVAKSLGNFAQMGHDKKRSF